MIRDRSTKQKQPDKLTKTRDIQMTASTDIDQFAVFPWHEHFNTGIKSIDQQHQQLVELLNSLANGLMSDEATENAHAFDELIDYARVHFEEEERLWIEYFQDDPWLIEHQQNHNSFVPELLEIKKLTQHQPPHSATEEVIHFLIHWLAFHILFDDKRMALAIRTQHQGIPSQQAKEHANQVMNSSMRELIDSVLSMYDGLSSRTLNLIRETKERQRAQEKLEELNQQLEHMSITDPLTGLHNRRYFDSVLQDELKRATRGQSPLSLMLIDLDHFKHLNDHYGHSAGDHALELVGKALNTLCRRPTDFCFRVGGEELAVICAGQSKQNAQAFAEMIRAHIEGLSIPNETSSASPTLTASVGLYTLVPLPTTDIKSLFSQADDALYTAKKSGRNQVVDSDESHSTAPQSEEHIHI